MTGARARVAVVVTSAVGRMPASPGLAGKYPLFLNVPISLVKSLNVVLYGLLTVRHAPHVSVAALQLAHGLPVWGWGNVVVGPLQKKCWQAHAGEE